MKASSVLLLSGALLAPSPAHAEQAAAPCGPGEAGTERDARAARLWRLAAEGARVSFGAAEVQLKVTKGRLGVTLSLPL